MQKKRPLSPTLIALVAAFAAADASAIGWGRAATSATLGQPLDFAVSLRLDPGDVVDPNCVSAEVMLGDNRLPSPAVRVAVDTSNPEALGIRVLTGSAVDEPVVAVTVAIGCPARMSRRFVLLADPPAAVPVVSILAAPPAASAPPAALAGVQPAAPPVAAVATPAASVPARPAPPVAAAPRPPRAEARAAEAPRKPVRKAPAPAPAPAASAPAAPAATATAAAPPPAPAAPPAAAEKPAAAPVARLKLDPVEPPPEPAAADAVAVEQALQAVASAASAVQSSASAAAAAEERVAALERTVAQLKADSAANREVMAELRGQVADARSASRWVMPLLLAVTALLGMAGWLWWRLRELNEERQRAWRAAAAATAAAQGPSVSASQLPTVNTEIPAQAIAAAAAAAAADAEAAPVQRLNWPPKAPAPAPVPDATDPAFDIPVADTQVLPVGSLADGGQPRDVTIEELLDLEQQAEFFIVLGQDEAAVDLLVHHLRDTGGGSPLPYLKLLEIYRRRGEREAYERTRTRFNHRFNAYAPEWDADLQHGRSLDDYPGVIPRLQQVWSRPLDAMAELEALLFRKSRGELFELPAYREVLFLYSLARDLLDREAGDGGNVDLLLPLGDGGEFSATSPHPYFGLERDSVFDGAAPTATERSTKPVDLDLSQPDEGATVTVVKPLKPTV